MPSKLTPVGFNVALVDPQTGYPTPYFQRLLQILLDEKTVDENNLANLGLDDLVDVDTTGLATNHVLKYNGTLWVPAVDSTLIGVRTITATGAGTYTPTTGTTSIIVEGQGGGGSGGGADAVAGQTAIAQSGSGGG
jgi:hypothetical protein